MELMVFTYAKDKRADNQLISNILIQ